MFSDFRIHVPVGLHVDIRSLVHDRHLMKTFNDTYM